MDNYAIETFNLTKYYGSTAVVKEVNLKVKTGEIYGFIGKNGAGKTTLIKMLTGLANPDSGNIKLFGEEDPKKLVNARKRIGSIIESPALYPNLSAYENLEVHRLLLNIKDNSVIKTLLDTVGLDYTDEKSARYFSMGNKQRLGLAVALMGKPDMLILDEPINGLDPSGMAEIRETLKKLNVENGTTILISSHILGELAKIADGYGVINKGVLVMQLSHEELVQKRTSAIKIVCDDTFKAIGVLEKTLNTTNYKIKNGAIFVYDFLNEPNTVNKALVLGDVMVKEFSVGGDDLEGYFLSLMEDAK